MAQKPKEVRAASKRQYTEVGGEVQLPWRGIHEWRKAEQGGWCRLVKQTQFCVPRELSNTAKLSVFKSVFVPILSHGHESWVMTKRVLFQVQVADTGFL